MSNDILTSLLSDYEQKKRKAEVEFEHQKTELYKKIPRLHEIEDELNSVAINETKNILLGNSSSLENLHQKIESLKEERKNILSENNLSYWIYKIWNISNSNVFMFKTKITKHFI